jgi:hypothetical protein
MDYVINEFISTTILLSTSNALKTCVGAHHRPG